MQADLEEAKTQENAKLHRALEDMQLEFQETKALLIKENEAAKNAAEQIRIMQEVPVVDNDMVNKLTAENEMLKVKFYVLLLTKPWIHYKASQINIY